MAELQRNESQHEERPGLIRRQRILEAARARGLLAKKDKQISHRTSNALYEAAARNTGLTGSQLLDYALANVALADPYPDHAERMLGTVDRSVDLEF